MPGPRRIAGSRAARLVALGLSAGVQAAVAGLLLAGGGAAPAPASRPEERVPVRLLQPPAPSAAVRQKPHEAPPLRAVTLQPLPLTAFTTAPSPMTAAAVPAALPGPPAAHAAPAAGPPPQPARPDYAHCPPPPYPPMARRMGLSGLVLLKVLVDERGAADEVRVQASSGHRVLDQAAVEAVLGWRFHPATQGRATLAAWVEVPVEFELQQ